MIRRRNPPGRVRLLACSMAPDPTKAPAEYTVGVDRDDEAADSEGSKGGSRGRGTAIGGVPVDEEERDLERNRRAEDEVEECRGEDC